MTVRLFARGSDGVVAITDGAITEATHLDWVNNPYKNINNIHFHSDFDYMSLQAKFTQTVRFPARAASSTTQQSNKGKSTQTIQIPETGSQRYTIGTHNLGYVPFATASRGGLQVTPTFPLQDNGSALRLINVEMDTVGAYVYESWATYTVGLAATSETFTVWIFRNPE